MWEVFEPRGGDCNISGGICVVFFRRHGAGGGVGRVIYKRNIFSVLPPEALFFEYCI